MRTKPDLNRGSRPWTGVTPNTHRPVRIGKCFKFLDNLVCVKLSHIIMSKCTTILNSAHLGYLSIRTKKAFSLISFDVFA